MGCRLLDQGQQQKRLNLIRNCVSSILQAPHTQEMDKIICQYQDKGTEVNARTAELYSKQGNIDITELVVIDTIAKSTMQGVSPSANVVQFCKRNQQKRRKR